MKKNNIKQCLELFKKNVYCIITSIVNAFNHKKCLSLSIQKYEIKPILINLHSKEYNQEFHYYLFAVKLDRWCCNTLNDLSYKVCVPKKQKI